VISLQERTGHKYNFSFHELFVALSRVRSADSIRLMHAPDASDEDFKYINDLRPNKNVLCFLAGFQATGTWRHDDVWAMTKTLAQ